MPENKKPPGSHSGSYRCFDACTAALRWLGEPVVLTDHVGSKERRVRLLFENPTPGAKILIVLLMSTNYGCSFIILRTKIPDTRISGPKLLRSQKSVEEFLLLGGRLSSVDTQVALSPPDEDVLDLGESYLL